MAFYAGASREKITPPIGTLLYGYRPDVVSETVHDDLDVTAVAFGDGSLECVMLSATLGDLQNELSDELRLAAAKAAGVAFDNVILAATHTHCGPNTSGMEGWGEIDRSFVDSILLPAVEKAAKQAAGSMEPAVLGIGAGESRVGINRRQRTEDGGIILGQNPRGEYDPAMTVLSFRRESDLRGIVDIVHYGCHGTACGMAHEITRDWSGVMLDRLEKESGTLSVFFNGAIGDVGPRLSNGHTTGDIGHVEELGSAAALDAVGIYRTIKSFHTPSLGLKTGRVKLPYQKNPPLEQIEKELSGVSEPEKLVNCERLRYEHLAAVRDMLVRGEDRDALGGFEFDVNVFDLGDAIFIPLPFEIFADTSLRLREFSGRQHTLALSCANGYNGYLPTQSDLALGGYESDVFRYASLYALADDTDQNLLTECLRIIRQ